MKDWMFVARASALSFVGLLFNVHIAVAQDMWRFALTGGLIYSTQGIQSAGQLVNNPSIPEPPLGGSVGGFQAGVEFSSRSIFGFGFEVSNTAALEGTQTLFHPVAANDPPGIELDKKHNDLIISGLVHINQRVIPHVSLNGGGRSHFCALVHVDEDGSCVVVS